MDPSRRNAWIQTIVGRDVSDTEQLSQRHFLRQKGSCAGAAAPTNEEFKQRFTFSWKLQLRAMHTAMYCASKIGRIV
jgi:hypothetical protein